MFSVFTIDAKYLAQFEFEETSPEELIVRTNAETTFWSEKVCWHPLPHIRHRAHISTTRWAFTLPPHWVNRLTAPDRQIGFTPYLPDSPDQLYYQRG